MKKRLLLILSISVVMLTGCVGGNDETDLGTEQEIVIENKLDMSEMFSENVDSQMEDEGGVYLDWKGNCMSDTLDEDAMRQVTRMILDCAHEYDDFYGDEPWKEKKLLDDRYAYLVPVMCEKDAAFLIYVELIYESDEEDFCWDDSVYLTSLKAGAGCYQHIINPFYKSGNRLYFEVTIYEQEYPEYTFIGLSWDKANNFSSNAYTPEEWEEYMGVYPKDSPFSP
ncbi:MAG: hypothetical protein IJ336_03800 [Lachnospiraceae bacterium]|nr:hypothetical protein [Lachnospiraceae bacterium]